MEETTILADLPAGARIGLDTAPVIYFIELTAAVSQNEEAEDLAQ